MRMRTVALFGILAAAVPMSSASAMTATKPGVVASTSTVVYKTDYRKKSYRKGRHYTPGGHYKRAPSNWHRYHKRPGNWRSRGCITVGPIWWCP